MKKKTLWFILLIASAVAVGALFLACSGSGTGYSGKSKSDDDDDDNDTNIGGQCNAGDKRCLGAEAQFCTLGKWATRKTCSSAEACRNGECIDECEPSCAGKTCGPDGCGGSCGQCESGQYCDGTKCEAAPETCGNTECDDGETCLNCAADCGNCCGNAECEAAYGENCNTCAADCACAEGQICTASGNCIEDCERNCTGKECGPDGCGGYCGQCPAEKPVCNANGNCEKGSACTPNCGGKQCGSDGCGGSCGTCPSGETCTEAGICSSSNCESSCGKLWTATCSSDGYGYRICGVDEADTACTKESIRIACAEGRTCKSGKCSGGCLIPEILFVVDRSSSMTAQRWEFMKNGLMQFVRDYHHRALMGIRMFPGYGSCDASSVVALQRYNATNIESNLTPPATSASTPISAALEGLKPHFGDPNEGQYVILLTDGGESCEEEFTPIEKVKILRTQGIKTFSVGVSREANSDLLTAMAEAAGTQLAGSQKFFLVQTQAELYQALKDVFNTMEGCHCYPNDKKCFKDEKNNLYYKACSSDGTKYTTDKKCDAACDETQGCYGECNPNVEDNAKCEGDATYYCDYTYTWKKNYDCGTEIGCNPQTGYCYSDCKPGRKYCTQDWNDYKYYEFVCNAEGTEYVKSKECPSGCADDYLSCRGGGDTVCNPSTDYKCVTIPSGCYYAGYKCSVKCKSDGSGFPTGTCVNDYYGCDGGSVCNSCNSSTGKCQ